MDDHRVVVQVLQPFGTQRGLADPGIAGDEGEHVGLDNEVAEEELPSLD